MSTWSITYLQLVLVVASILASTADAFRSSAKTIPAPIIVPLDLPLEGTNQLPQIVPSKLFETSATQTTRKTSQKTFKYDLGLGKNKPVTSKSQQLPTELGSVDLSLNPTQFLVDHVSVRSYPSPLDSSSRNKSSEPKRRRENLPRIQHRRHSEDVLRIRDHISVENSKPYKDSFYPVMVPITKNYSAARVKLDVNTVWVEMMLHNEQQKLLVS